MRLPLSWLNEYVKVDDIDPKELAEKLTRAARSDGMHTLLESALKKLGSQEIPLGEVVRVLGLG